MKKYYLLPLISLLLICLSCRGIPKKGKLSFSSSIHTFYYPWFGNPEVDGEYRHWKHDVLPHWSDTTWNNAGTFPGGEDIGANYYPELGCYSSNDTAIIHKHMKMMVQAGIGVLVYSWWGKGSFEDNLLPSYLDIAEDYGVKVAFHLEPYYKSAKEFKEQIQYIHASYGNHASLYRLEGKPFYYVYDSYELKAEEWKKLLVNEGGLGLRGGPLDAVFIGLWVQENEQEFFMNSGFDGFYTYFASDGFVYGSTSVNWPKMSAFANKNDLIFIPCVGPGYVDTRIRPWNSANTKERKNGEYYERMFTSAAALNPPYIGITSFNEWHEGSQIEPAVPKSIEGYQYEDYGKTVDPWVYIRKTRELIDKNVKK